MFAGVINQSKVNRSIVEIGKMSLKNRLQQLDDVEREVVEVLRTGASCLTEASKEKIAPKTVERFATEYLNKLKNIESSMLEQINYLNQIGSGAAHEGSAYLPLRQERSASERTEHFSGVLREAIRKEDETKDVTDRSMMDTSSPKID